MADVYKVVLTRQAQEEIDQAHDWWAKHRSAEQANKRYIGFFEAMIRLEENPERCSLAPDGIMAV